MNIPAWLLEAARENVLGKLTHIDQLMASETNTVPKKRAKRTVQAALDSADLTTKERKFHYKKKRTISPEARERMRVRREERKKLKLQTAQKAA